MLADVSLIRREIKCLQVEVLLHFCDQHDVDESPHTPLSVFNLELYLHSLRDLRLYLRFFPAAHFTSDTPPPSYTTATHTPLSASEPGKYTANEQVIFPSEKLDSSVQGERWKHIIVLFLTHPHKHCPFLST